MGHSSDEGSGLLCVSIPASWKMCLFLSVLPVIVLLQLPSEAPALEYSIVGTFMICFAFTTLMLGYTAIVVARQLGADVSNSQEPTRFRARRASAPDALMRCRCKAAKRGNTSTSRAQVRLYHL